MPREPGFHYASLLRGPPWRPEIIGGLLLLRAMFLFEVQEESGRKLSLVAGRDGVFRNNQDFMRSVTCIKFGPNPAPDVF